jgi:hypothetical protein
LETWIRRGSIQKDVDGTGRGEYNNDRLMHFGLKKRLEFGCGNTRFNSKDLGRRSKVLRGMRRFAVLLECILGVKARLKAAGIISTSYESRRSFDNKSVLASRDSDDQPLRFIRRISNF